MGTGMVVVQVYRGRCDREGAVRRSIAGPKWPKAGSSPALLMDGVDGVRILVTNDDGVEAPGIAALARAAHRSGHEVVVVAPLEDWSGASAAVGAFYRRDGVDYRTFAIAGLEDIPTYGIDGPPALGVILACVGGFGKRPDIVLSGINHGVNVGRSALHSGTIGAVLTAAQFADSRPCDIYQVRTRSRTLANRGGPRSRIDPCARFRADRHGLEPERSRCTSARFARCARCATGRGGTIRSVSYEEFDNEGAQFETSASRDSRRSILTRWNAARSTRHAAARSRRPGICGTRRSRRTRRNRRRCTAHRAQFREH